MTAYQILDQWWPLCLAVTTLQESKGAPPCKHESNAPSNTEIRCQLKLTVSWMPSTAGKTLLTHVCTTSLPRTFSFTGWVTAHLLMCQYEFGSGLKWFRVACLAWSQTASVQSLQINVLLNQHNVSRWSCGTTSLCYIMWAVRLDSVVRRGRNNTRERRKRTTKVSKIWGHFKLKER